MKLKMILVIAMALSASAHADEHTHHWQFGVGPSYISGLNTNDISSSWRFGYGWGVTSNVDMAVIADWASSNQNTDMHYFTVKLSGDYNFSEENTTPFVTADIGYASVHAHWDCTDPSCEDPADDANGAALGVGAGYKFFRSSCMQLGLLARYDVVLASTRRGTPMKSALQALLYF